MLELEFYSKVPKDGFRWAEARRSGHPERGMYLVDSSQKAVQLGLNRRLPRALFRSFFELEPIDESQIQAFANKHGLLGGSISRELAPIEEKGNVFPFRVSFGSGNSIRGEALDDWKKEILEMRSIATLWDALMKSDRKVIAKFIRWTHSKLGTRNFQVIEYLNPDAAEFDGELSFEIASEGTPESFSRFSNGDLLGPARYAIQRLINPKLREHPTVPKLFRQTVRGKESLRIRNAPESLISALWAQFAYAIDGDRAYSRCEQCGTPFEVQGLREGAKFCKDACKSRAYRSRQVKAKTLSEGGMTTEEIAEELGSEVPTVKGWIK